MKPVGKAWGAILGAMVKGDIGAHTPPGEQWRTQISLSSGSVRFAIQMARWQTETPWMVLFAFADVSTGTVYSIFGLHPYATPPLYLST